MEKVWEFFEHMNELVYVTDMDTHEIIYMNQKMRNTFGFESLPEVTGKKCYEVIQNCSEPCAICNDHELQEGYFKEWKYFNPTLGRYFALKDTMLRDGERRCRVEIALDAGIQEWQSSVIHNYQNLETLANEGMRIALQAPTPDRSIEVILEYLGKTLEGERTYIFEQNGSGGDDNTYEWVASGVTPEKENLQNLPPEVCMNWYQNFSENKHIIIKSLEDIRERDPLQYENLKRQNIHSLVVVPLYDEGKVIGFYGVDNPPATSLDYASDMLQIIGHFMISSIKRRNLVRQLRDMSYHDQLTKLGNRYALDEYTEKMPKQGCIGVVYCDITGLKRTNDTKGHKAGDQLILDACECLRKSFGEYGLFRVGGDEMVALCPGITQDMLDQKLQTLRDFLAAYEVNMAVGADWKEICIRDVNRLMTAAEEKMYEDKAAYYRTHTDLLEHN